jgi:hypothetical protein
MPAEGYDKAALRKLTICVRRLIDLPGLRLAE